MLSLESPHRSDSNENTQYTIINIKKSMVNSIPNMIMSVAMGFFLGTKEQVRNSRGAISVRATEVLQ